MTHIDTHIAFLIAVAAVARLDRPETQDACGTARALLNKGRYDMRRGRLESATSYFKAALEV